MTERIRAALTALILVASLAAPHAAIATPRADAPVAIVVTGSLGAGVDLGPDVLDRLPVPALGFERLRVPAGAADRVLSALRAQGYEARRDSVVSIAKTPNDPGYPGQWAHPRVRAEGAWSRTQGAATTVVAVLDTGLLEAHEDLQGAVVPGWNFVHDDDDTTDDHLAGTHGTAVAGVVAARTDNDTGVAGTCWRCTVMPLKVLDSEGNGYSSDIAAAIVYATDHGADVINMSLGGPVRETELEKAVSYASARGVVMVAAAGNSGVDEKTYPAAFDGVIAVGASDENDGRYAFSNHGTWVSVAAPGCTVTTVSLAYGSFCGTSAAAPVVAGLAGLIRSVRPDLPASDVRTAIEEGAVPIGAWLDHGRVDATNSVPITPTDGNLYRAVEPARILDTRDGTGGRAGKLGQRESLRLDVTGVGGVPSSGIAAVVLNVTATQPTEDSYLTVHPAGTTRPVASNLNLVAGQTIPNLVTVKVGAGGKVDIFNFNGSTHVVADVAGYYLEAGGGAMFAALAPARILDTRNGTGGIGGPLVTDQTVTLPVAGSVGVPRHGVSAVALNVTAVAGTRNSHLTIYPAGTARPTASTVNFARGDVIPNLAIAKLGRDGKLRIHNNTGEVDVVVDVLGYFTLNHRGASFHPLTPQRVVDTRNGTGGAGGALGHRATRRVALAGVGGVPSTGVSSVVANVTAVDPTAQQTYLTVYPAATTRPTASNLNLRQGEVFPNLVSATLGTGGKVDVYNHSGETHLVVDVSGYFAGG